MTRPVIIARLKLPALLLAQFAWSYLAGSMVAFLEQTDPEIGFSIAKKTEFLVVLLVAVNGAFVISRLPAVARKCGWYSASVIGYMNFFGAIGLLFGLGNGYAPAIASHLAFCLKIHLVVLAIVSLLLSSLTQISAKGGDLPTLRAHDFFLLADAEIADFQTRNYLFISIAFWSVFLVGIGCSFHGNGELVLSTSTLFDFSTRGWVFCASYMAGMALMLWQFHWCRALGIVPWAWLLLAIGLTRQVFPGEPDWPISLIGLAGGLAHSPLCSAVISSVPPRQRMAALMVEAFAVVFVVIVSVTCMPRLIWWGSNWKVEELVIPAAVAWIATFLCTWPLLWRNFVELINELVFRVLWWPKGYGPGLHAMPTRGPLLIVANHGAWFDPVWVAAVVPLHTRALMSAGFLDKPFLKWLCGSVYRAIRVPDEGFRRTAPEIDEAVAALKQGWAVMIFPEGWLRRREEQHLRRFANGVHRILTRCPNTPVVACWIEDGWGSSWSHKNGPPGKNKPKDILKRIRIGVSAPEVLPADLLADDIATRQYLMQAVLSARTHLGLPALPMPGASVDEKEEEPRTE